MIAAIVSSPDSDIEVRHVRMQFSSRIDEVGKASIRKVGHLIGLIARILVARVVQRTEVLYYPPAGPETVPIVRDIVTLISVRWAFRATVLHFHAAGLGDRYESFGRVGRAFFRRAYFGAEVAVCMAETGRTDAERVAARNVVVVPYGIPDAGRAGETAERTSRPRILFVGAVRESKGVSTLLEAIERLSKRKGGVDLMIAGPLESDDYGEELRRWIADHDLEGTVTMVGEVLGPEKDALYRSADVFCFPTHYENESFPVVIIEAMMFGLPIVATRWRSIPDMVRHGENGLLVGVQDSAALAAALDAILDSADLAQALGDSARRDYEQRYAVERYTSAISACFRLAADSPR